MQELTPRQASILTFVENFIRKNQQPPAEREIAGHFRIHQSAIRKHLNALERKGKLTLRRDGRSRGIRLNNMTPATSVPIVDVTDGAAPLLAQENLEGSMMLDTTFVGSEDAFLFRVDDSAMADSGIAEDDLLLVRSASTVRNGEIVVARIGESVVVRRYFNIAGKIVLEAASREHLPITIHDEASFQLEGRVAALIRTIGGQPGRKKKGRKEERSGEEEKNEGGDAMERPTMQNDPLDERNELAGNIDSSSMKD
jgi:repressor LexA